MKINYNRIQKDMISDLSKGKVKVKTLGDKTYYLNSVVCYIVPKEKNVLKENCEENFDCFLMKEHNFPVGLYRKEYRDCVINGKKHVKLVNYGHITKDIYVLKSAIKNINLDKMIISSTEKKDIIYFEDEETRELVCVCLATRQNKEEK